MQVATSTNRLSKRRRRAFTLVELLVVISIIGLLIALLLPSLRKARSQSKRTVCAANLRQIGVSLQAYLLDNNDRLPEVSFLPSTGPFPLTLEDPIYIADVLSPFASREPALTSPGDDDDEDEDEPTPEPARESIFRCPNDRPDDTRPDENAGLSYYESERSSYVFRWQLGGETIMEVASKFSNFTDRTVAANSIWIMRDYNNFHAKGGEPGARRYLYIDGHVTDFEN